MDYDLFNGDADGICSLIQLRLTEPRDAVLVTGIKRDIKLLNQIDPKAGDRITVLDISMDKNQAGLAHALEAGASVFYADHHRSGDILDHPRFIAHINTAATTCTALIVNQLLGGKYQDWAIVAAFGDNITQVAEALVDQAGYDSEQKLKLRKLGVAMNYNGYGVSVDDLFYHPAELYRFASGYQSPLDFITERSDVYETLNEGYEADLDKGLGITPFKASETAAMIQLPNEKWARRISGVLGNELANQYPDSAHAILTEREERVAGKPTYQVSIRAAKSKLIGADTIAMKFGGGGRTGAAGINRLLAEELDAFWTELLSLDSR